MRVSPACDLPSYSYERSVNPGKLVIVNLQKTPFDKYCETSGGMRIGGKIDDFFKIVMNELNIECQKFEVDTLMENLKKELGKIIIDPDFQSELFVKNKDNIVVISPSKTFWCQNGLKTDNINDKSIKYSDHKYDGKWLNSYTIKSYSKSKSDIKVNIKLINIKNEFIFGVVPAKYCEHNEYTNECVYDFINGVGYNTSKCFIKKRNKDKTYKTIKDKLSKLKDNDTIGIILKFGKEYIIEFFVNNETIASIKLFKTKYQIVLSMLNFEDEIQLF